uniref:Natriuretic peptide receptor 3 n=1 Tax=Scleropages formosus TaxID=113540 RepID=A0A8C9V6J0_SCLFO
FISVPCCGTYGILIQLPSERARAEHVDVLVLLPRNASYIFSVAAVRPAIELAQRSIASERRLRFAVRYEDSGCGDRALFSLVDRGFAQKPDLILGPVCEYAASDVVRVASHWDVPVVSAGALATGFARRDRGYTHLTRIGPSYLKMARSISALFRHFGWQSALLLYEDDREERNCYFTVEAVHSALEAEQLSTEALSLYPRERAADGEDIARLIEGNEVVIMCAGGDIVRDIMLTAHHWKLTNGNYIYFNIELFNASSYGNGSWKRGDQYDTEAKQAYAALNILTLLRSVKPEFQNFSLEVKRSIRKAGVPDHDSGDNVNMFVEGFHDALLLYSLALQDAVKNGFGKNNGSQITQLMWNRTFEGIAGQVSIDANGDRNGDFSVMAMTDFEAGSYKAVFNYYGINGSFQVLPGFNSDRFTLRERHRPVSAEKSCGLGMSTAMGIVVGAVLGTVLVLALYFFRKYKIIVERRCQQEDYSMGKHHQLREDSIRSDFL